MLILLNKPYRVLSQFQDADGRATLKNYIDVPDVYPAGRLDYESEGMLVLTDDGRLQARISQPTSSTPKTYWTQVEGNPTDSQVQELIHGVALKDGWAKADSARRIDPPASLWDRDPPIRFRQSIPDFWLEITLSQGRNRQIRRMTAAVGLPTLRLIRYAIGPWTLAGLAPGGCRSLETADAWRQLMQPVRDSV
jgi:23S rRNA pseudouridine2457 synthase